MFEKDQATTSQARIEALANSINNHLLEQCKQHNYLAAELYIAMKWLLASMAVKMGREMTDEIDKKFKLVHNFVQELLN